MVIFENVGILPIECISTFGVSIKSGKMPFGYFGTGLKYAIAILLRNKQEITIHSADEKYKFAIETRIINNKSFNFVKMNDQLLGFTTDVGKDWKMWQAYRELYCNCMDEGGRVHSTLREPRLTTNKTYIICEGQEIEHVHVENDNIILQSKPLYTNTFRGLEIHSRKAKALYYRTIKAYELQSVQSLFTYNFTGQMALTEDRTIKHLSEAEETIVKSVLESSDPSFIKAVACAPEGTLEHKLSFTNTYVLPGQTFLQTIKKEILCVNSNINLSVLAVYKAACKKFDDPITANLTEEEKLELTNAIKFCEDAEFNVTKYPIIVAEGMVNDILGLAQNNKIFISIEALSKGQSLIASILIEEFIHLSEHLSDETRAMQTYLLGIIVKMCQKLLKE